MNSSQEESPITRLCEFRGKNPIQLGAGNQGKLNKVDNADK